MGCGLTRRRAAPSSGRASSRVCAHDARAEVRCVLHVVVRRHHRCRRRRRDDECDEPESRLGLIITNQRRHQTSPKTDSLTVFLRLHSRRGRGVRIAMGWCSENHRHVRRRATIGDRGTRAVVASVNRSRFASDIFPHSPLTRARRPPHRLHSMPSSHLRYTPRHTSSTPCGRSRNVLEPPERSRATSRARNANSSPVASSPPTPSTPHHRHIARESPSSSSSSSSSRTRSSHPCSRSTRPPSQSQRRAHSHPCTTPARIAHSGVMTSIAVTVVTASVARVRSHATPRHATPTHGPSTVASSISRFSVHDWSMTPSHVHQPLSSPCERKTQHAR